MSISTPLLAVISAAALSASPGRAAGAHPSPRHQGKAQATSERSAEAGAPQVVELSVTSEGFVPARVTVKRGRPVKLVVTRKTDLTCATEIVMKSLGVRKELPLGEPVTVTVTPPGPGEYRYACGMDMVAGVLAVE